jgi:hypothetical protein
MYTGSSDPPYMSIIPLWEVFVEELRSRGLHAQADLIERYL